MDYSKMRALLSNAGSDAAEALTNLYHGSIDPEGAASRISDKVKDALGKRQSIQQLEQAQNEKSLANGSLKTDTGRFVIPDTPLPFQNENEITQKIVPEETGNAFSKVAAVLGSPGKMADSATASMLQQQTTPQQLQLSQSDLESMGQPDPSQDVKKSAMYKYLSGLANGQ